MPRRRSRLWKWSLLGLAGLLPGLWLLFEAAVFFTPLPSALQRQEMETVILSPGDLQPQMVLDRHGEPLLVLSGDEAREFYPVPLADLSPWLVRFTVGLEDRRFYSHGGVDWFALGAAMWRNTLRREVHSGASTISQQLIKLASQRQGRGRVWDKIYEALAAVKLERRWSKDEILEAYLNRLDYGNRRIGPEAAARAYFGKSAADLRLEEALFLAGLPQSPTRLNPWLRPEAAMARFHRNAQRLERVGFLPETTTAGTLVKPRVARLQPPVRAEQFAREAAARQPGQAIVHTSLDPDLQGMAEFLAHEHLRALDSYGARSAAVVIVENRTGEVRAMVSIAPPEQQALNAATTPRSPGSAIKPFLYLAAIDDRVLTAASLLPDTPEAIRAVYRDYDPRNYSGRYFGPVRVREALASSLNVPAVVATSRVGARQAFYRLRNWGLDFPGEFDQYGAGFILGNAPVSLLDLTGAYASMARGGRAWSPLLSPYDALEGRPMASRESCWIVTDILADNPARSLGFGLRSPLQTSQRTAVKTGTSSGFRDAWAVGYNADHTVGVWVGNLDGRTMDELLAVRSAAPLWKMLMENLLARGDRPLPSTQDTSRLVQLDVEPRTGLLPEPGDRIIREWFLAGSEPVESADSMRDSEGTLVLPAEYAAWCQSLHNFLGARVASAELTILYPAPESRFVIDPTLRLEQQRFAAASSHPETEWRLNGELLESNLIPLRPGEWTLTAQAGENIEEVRFVVD